jgi:hypothetical protein
VCFFGHHPLLSWKIKKEKVKREDDMIELHAFLLDILTKNNLQKKTIYYFCAHLHQYQKGTVTISQHHTDITIHQYISGTGGAHLDPEIPSEYIKKETEPVAYQNIKSSYQMLESIEKNGFLTINTIESDLLLVKFHQVIFSRHNTSIKSKSLSKTRKTKSKRKTPSRYSSLLKKLHISQSLGGKTRRIKRKYKKNKH